MGFGLLFVGCFFANLMPVFEPLGFTKLIGYPMMLLALRRLSAYHSRFRVCYFAGFASLPFAAFYTYAAFYAMKVPMPPIPDTVNTIVGWAYFAFFVVFEMLLLWAIAGLSGELHHIRLTTGATRNMIFVGLFAVLYAGCNILEAVGVSAVRYFYVPLLLFRICFFLLDAWLIFCCYRDICPAEEEQIQLMSDDAEKKDREEKHNAEE